MTTNETKTSYSRRGWLWPRDAGARQQAVGTVVEGVEIVGGSSDLQRLHDDAGFDQLIVTIGNNKLREELYSKAKALGYSFPNIICSSTYISPHGQIGCACVLLNNVVVQNGGYVGDGVLLNPGVEVHNNAFVDDYTLIYTNSVVRALAHVGKRVRIGSTVSISNNVNVADDSDIHNRTTL